MAPTTRTIKGKTDAGFATVGTPPCIALRLASSLFRECQPLRFTERARELPAARRVSPECQSPVQPVVQVPVIDLAVPTRLLRSASTAPAAHDRSNSATTGLRFASGRLSCARRGTASLPQQPHSAAPECRQQPKPAAFRLWRFQHALHVPPRAVGRGIAVEVHAVVHVRFSQSASGARLREKHN